MPKLDWRTSLTNVSRTFSVKWTVENFEELPTEPDSYVESAIFGDPARQTRWQMRFYPGAETANDIFISQIILRLTSERPVLASFHIRILGPDGKVCFISQNSRYNAAEVDSGWIEFLSRERLLSRRALYLPGGNLTLQCEVSLENILLENKYPLAEHRLSTALRTQGFYDLTLVASSEEIRTHRAVLSSVSPVFAAMFFPQENGEKREEVTTDQLTSSRLEITNLKVKTLKFLIDFAYEGFLDLQPESLEIVEDLLMAANTYQVDSLRKLCIRELASRLTPSSAAQLLVITDRLNLSQLYTDVIQLIKSNSLAVMTSPEWIELTEQKEVLKKALQALANLVTFSDK